MTFRFPALTVGIAALGFSLAACDAGAPTEPLTPEVPHAEPQREHHARAPGGLQRPPLLGYARGHLVLGAA